MDWWLLERQLLASLLTTDLDSTVYTTESENYSYFCRNNNGTDDERFFNNPNYDTVILSEPHQYSLDGPQDTPFSSGTQPPDATYDATSDEKDHVQEVRGVGLYSTYDVITIENIDHRDEDNTEEAAVVAKFQKEGVHKEEEEAALYSVVTKPQDILTVPEEY